MILRSSPLRWLPLVALLNTPPTLAAQQRGFAPSLGIDLSAMQHTGAVRWHDVTAGGGQTARDGSLLTIHYTGWLADGTQFESSRDADQPVAFRMGEGQVIRGWENGIRGMRAGGSRRLVIPPRLAYGGRGVPGKVPPNATLIFLVELVAIGR